MRFLFLISAIALGTLAVADDKAPVSAQAQADGSGQQSLRDLLGSKSEEEPLPPERAFVMHTEAVAPDAVSVTFTPAPTYYLYRNKFAFAVVQPAAVSVHEVQLPSGAMKEDPIFGRTEVYHDSVRALLSLRAPSPLPGEVELDITMQGCTERGLCYPPDTRRVKVALADAVATNASGAAATPVSAPPAAVPTHDTGALPWAVLALGVAALVLLLWRRWRRPRP